MVEGSSSSGGVTRRRALAVGGVALGGAAVAACGGGGSSKSGTTSPQAGSPATGTQKIQPGGVMRVGVSGGGSTETLDPAKAQSDGDIQRAYVLYEALAQRDPDYKLEMVMAETIEPKAKGKVWIVRLRDGVEFHNGKTMTADDVLYTWKRILDPKFPNVAVGRLRTVDMKATKKIDDRTIEVHLIAPNVAWPENLGGSFTRIVPEGFDPRSPVGTGPFKYKSFKAGERSTFVKFENYWRTGQPHFDQLDFINFSDDTARVNALVGGQVDAITNLPSSQIGTVKANPKLKPIIGPTGNYQPFTMRVDKAPFDDVRVRTAFRLMVDRKQMIDQALSGQGAVANDMFARYDASTSSIPQREQDIEQAKSLLKAAGRSDLTVELVTAPIFAGVVEAATVFAQQAKAAGVNVKVRKVDGGTFFGPQYLKWPFAQDFWLSNMFIPQCFQCVLPTSPLNETHYDNPKFTNLVTQLSAELDETKRNELIVEAQKILHDDGGYIIWSFSNSVDATSAKVTGIKPSKYGGPLGNAGFGAAGFVAT